MSGWMTFWTWALLIGLTFFAAVVVVVTVGGLRDIRDMLRSLKAGHQGQGGGGGDDPPATS
jgi:hypothetical protein